MRVMLSTESATATIRQIMGQSRSIAQPDAIPAQKKSTSQFILPK